VRSPDPAGAPEELADRIDGLPNPRQLSPELRAGRQPMTVGMVGDVGRSHCDGLAIPLAIWLLLLLQPGRHRLEGGPDLICDDVSR
jgi:hypothetical protein